MDRDYSRMDGSRGLVTVDQLLRLLVEGKVISPADALDMSLGLVRELAADPPLPGVAA